MQHTPEVREASILLKDAAILKPDGTEMVVICPVCGRELNRLSYGSRLSSNEAERVTIRCLTCGCHAALRL